MLMLPPGWRPASHRSNMFGRSPGGLWWAPIVILRLSYYLPEATVWAQPRMCAAITAAKNSASVFIFIGTCSSVLRLAWRHTSSD